jgi:hypothetical protein
MLAFTERAAGERLFVDYAGHTVDVICPKTGEVRTAQIFVATLGASSYTYVEASWTQSLPDWVSSHVRAFEFFGGVPAQLVPDNLEAGVTKACFYDPAINRACVSSPDHAMSGDPPAAPHPQPEREQPEGPRDRHHRKRHRRKRRARQDRHLACACHARYVKAAA